MWTAPPEWRPTAAEIRLGTAGWGPSGWKWLHGMAISYPASPTMDDAVAAVHALYNFRMRVPCVECVAHFSEYLTASATMPELASGEAFQLWMWRFHNVVNVRLHKRYMPFTEYLQTWREEIEAADLLHV